jgi:hypothetical protein
VAKAPAGSRSQQLREFLMSPLYSCENSRAGPLQYLSTVKYRAGTTLISIELFLADWRATTSIQQILALEMLGKPEITAPLPLIRKNVLKSSQFVTQGCGLAGYS